MVSKYKTTLCCRNASKADSESEPEIHNMDFSTPERNVNTQEPGLLDNQPRYISILRLKINQSHHSKSWHFRGWHKLTCNNSKLTDFKLQFSLVCHNRILAIVTVPPSLPSL